MGSIKGKPQSYVYVSYRIYLNIEGTRNLLYDYYLEDYERNRIKIGEVKALEHMKRLKNMSSKEKEKQKILRDYNKLYK